MVTKLLIAEPRDPQRKDALPQEGLAYGCSAIRPPPLEAWIRWVAPFYVLTITFRKPDCVHLASDSVVGS